MKKIRNAIVDVFKNGLTVRFDTHIIDDKVSINICMYDLHNWLTESISYYIGDSKTGWMINDRILSIMIVTAITDMKKKLLIRESYVDDFKNIYESVHRFMLEYDEQDVEIDNDDFDKLYFSKNRETAKTIYNIYKTVFENPYITNANYQYPNFEKTVINIVNEYRAAKNKWMTDRKKED